jgi:hypothetical protein
MKQAERTVRDLLALANIEIDGPNPWDIKVHDSQFYARVLSNAALGLGESYMDGWLTPIGGVEIDGKMRRQAWRVSHV